MLRIPIHFSFANFCAPPLAALAANDDDDDDVYDYICERLKLEGETENKGVCTKERKGVTA